MFWLSIKRKIVSIALGLIILMVITSVLSIIMANKVDYLLNELTTKYIAAYGHLARTNIRSLERALALRRMVIAKMESPPDKSGYAARLKIFEQKGREVEKEAGEARKLIAEIIADANTPSDSITLARIDGRIDTSINDFRRYLSEETTQLISQLETQDFIEAKRTLTRVDTLRDEFNQKIDSVRADMLKSGLCERYDGYARSAASNADLSNCDSAGCNSRIDFRDPCQLRHHPPGSAVTGGYT